MKQAKMTPEDAAAKYKKEWPALNAAKEAAVAAGDVKTAKKCRQLLSYLSRACAARHELGKSVESSTQFCPHCGGYLEP